MDNFNLSQKIFFHSDYDDKMVYSMLDIEDVKEFIRLLKESDLFTDEQHEIIDKLAGEKLC